MGAKKIDMSQKHSQQKGLHEALLAVGFAYMQSSQVYIYEAMVEGDEMIVMLDCLSAESLHSAASHLGMCAFSSHFLSRAQKLAHQRLAQHLIREFENSNVISAKKAANE